MSYCVLSASKTVWRPSNELGVHNCDLAKQLEATTLGACLWRLRPGQASMRHWHRSTAELLRGLACTGRLHVADDVLTLVPLDLLLVEPTTIRQLFNDTASDELWLVVGAPGNTLEMSAAELTGIYSDVRKALPAELQGMDG